MRTSSLKPHAVTNFSPKNEKHRTDGVDFPPEAEQRIVGKGNHLYTKGGGLRRRAAPGELMESRESQTG